MTEHCICENGYQLFTRLQKLQYSFVNFPFFSSFVQISEFNSYPKLLEIVGTESSGKTRFLSYLILWTLLPEEFEGYNIGGKGKAVLWLDCDFKFSVLNFVTILENFLSNHFTNYPSYLADHKEVSLFHLNSLREICLSNLYVLKCQTSSELVANLLALPDYLRGNSQLRLIIIDGITDEFWIDQTLRSQRLYESAAIPRLVSTLEKLSLIENINIVLSRGVVCLMSKGSYFGENKSNFGKVYDWIGKIWDKFISFKIYLERQYSNSALYTATIRKSPDYLIGSTIKFSFQTDGIKF